MNYDLDKGRSVMRYLHSAIRSKPSPVPRDSQLRFLCTEKQHENIVNVRTRKQRQPTGKLMTGNFQLNLGTFWRELNLFVDSLQIFHDFVEATDHVCVVDVAKRGVVATLTSS